MVALGGIVFGPALAVGGFWMASKAEAALSNAYSYSAKVDKAVAEMKTVQTVLKAIRTAAAEQASVIVELSKRFEQVKVNAFHDQGFERMYIVGKALGALFSLFVAYGNEA